jgi:uroporphyrinogen decarboxylase
MDGRTRVRNTVERKPVDRIPMHESPWEDTVARWESEGLPKGADLAAYFDWDIVGMSVDLSMRLPRRLIADDGEYRTLEDRYGYTVRHIKGKSRTFECLRHVNTGRDAWRNLAPRFRFDPADTARIDDRSSFLRLEEYPGWEEARRKFDRLRATGKYIVFDAYGPYEGTWRHRGYGPLLMDIALDPEWVTGMGKAQNDLLMDVLRHAVRIGMKPDALWLVDDLGSTRGLLMSPESWRAIFKPIYRELGAFLRSQGIGFWLHSCGNVEALIPDFIECGLDVLQPLQAHAGMDVRKLKPLYGDRLTFWGNIDARLMSGSDAEIEAEIRDKITFAKQGGGYMYHSDHSVPPEVSLARFRHILELVRRYGAYG